MKNLLQFVLRSTFVVLLGLGMIGISSHSAIAQTCCTAHAGTGCEDAACEAAVCAADNFCCNTEWDGLCADEALSQPACEGVSDCPGGGGGGSGTCCTSHTGTGCENSACETAICALDGFCCSTEWDTVCAGLAVDDAEAGGSCELVSNCPAASGGGTSCISTTSYGTPTIPNNGSGVSQTGTWAGEYVPFSGVLTGNDYDFSSSVGSDWLVLTDDANNVILEGTTPLSWTGTYDGTVRLHVWTNSSCGTENVGRELAAVCTSCTPPTSCISSTEWDPGTIPNTGAGVTVTGGWAGEYVPFSGALSGNDYTFSSSNGSDWLVLTDDANNVLEEGTTPISWTGTFDGTVRLHYWVNSSCGTENVGRDLTAVCTSCTAPPPGPGEDCSDPLVVGALPYSTTDNTINYGNNYAGSPGSNCSSTSSYLSGDDVVYSYTATFDGGIDITMSPTNTWSGIFVYGDCADIGVACLAGEANSSSDDREILGFSVTNGETYYIVISTWPTPDNTAYTLMIDETPPAEGCTDPAALNYDPAAVVDDGSCVTPTCPDAPVAVSHCYGNNADDQFVYNAASPGDMPIIQINSGTTESGFDDLTIYDGDNTAAPVLYTGDGDHSGVTVQSTSGSLLLQITSDGSVSCASGSFCCSAGLDWSVYCAAIPGCTDPAALNFDPAATTDDGSCDYPIVSCGLDSYSYCYGNNEDTRFYYQAATGSDLYLALTAGQTESGWDFLEIYDGFSTSDNLLFSGSGMLPIGTTYHSTTGNIMVRITSDGSVNCQANGYVHIAYDVSCTPPPIFGCTDPAANNYNPDATDEDGSCIYPPANDDCANAFAIACGGTASGSTATANASAPGTCVTTLGSAPGVWYEVTGINGIMTASLCGSDFDTKIGVFSGTCGALVCENGNDDDNGTGGAGVCGGGLVSSTEWVGSPGTTYYIYVTGFSTATGNYELAVDCVPFPANNDCVDAQNLNVAAWPSTSNSLGTLYGATNGGGAACISNADGGDVYYTFTAGTENHYWVNVNPFGGADVAVEVTDACGGAVVACEDSGLAGGTESAFIQNLPAGTYTVRVYTSSGAATSGAGNFLINVQSFPVAQVQANPANFMYACNTTDRQLEEIVGASPQTGQMPSILDYEWEIHRIGGGFSNTWQRGGPNYATKLTWLGMEYGETYNVYVRVLINVAGVGPVWGVHQVLGGLNPEDAGASTCTIATSSSVTQTEVRPQYTPTNLQGNDYSMCNVAVAFSVADAENYEWEFNDGINPPVYYERGVGNPSVKLSWVNCLKPNTTYQVRVRANVDGQWGTFGNAQPMVMAPTANTALRANMCGTTRGLFQWLLPNPVCIADSYEYRLTNTMTGDVHTSLSTVLSGGVKLDSFSPELVPGAEYVVEVKATQCGEEGDYSSTCNITIAGPQAQGDETPAVRTMAENSATLYPNPNAGTEVRVELSGLGDGNHEVMIQIYDVYGKLIQTEGFGHAGSDMSRLVRFDGNLAMGMYMVQFVVDGERFTTERLVVK